MEITSNIGIFKEFRCALRFFFFFAPRVQFRRKFVTLFDKQNAHLFLINAICMFYWHLLLSLECCTKPHKSLAVTANSL